MRATNFATVSNEAPAEPAKLPRRYRGAHNASGSSSNVRAFNRQQALISSGAQLSGDDSSAATPSPSVGDLSGRTSGGISATASLSSKSVNSDAELIPPLPLEEDDDDAPLLDSELTASLVLNEPATSVVAVEAPVALIGDLPMRSDLGPEAAAAECQPPPPVCDTPAPPPDGTIEALKAETSGATPRDGSSNGSRTPPGDPSTPVAVSPEPRVLPWTSKVRAADIETFLQAERQKFYGYRLPNDRVSLFGLPPPVVQSVNAMRRNLYTSLGELEVCRRPI